MDYSEFVRQLVTEMIDNTNFRKWFGKSKIIDADGSPKILYHGSKSSIIKIFKKESQVFGHHGNGFYFTDRRHVAETYGHVYSVYLKIENPFVMYREYDVSEIKMIFGDDWTTHRDLITNKLKDFYSDKLFGNEFYSYVSNDRLAEIGFDGIIHGDVYVVFEPNQIKSTRNDGSFDLDDANIYS